MNHPYWSSYSAHSPYNSYNPYELHIDDNIARLSIYNTYLLNTKTTMLSTYNTYSPNIKTKTTMKSITDNYPKFRIKNITEYKVLLTILFEYGIKHYENKSFDHLVTFWNENQEYSDVGVDLDKKTFCGYYEDDNYLDVFSNMKDLVAILSVNIITVGDYKATYDKHNIKVGCQTLSYAKIKEVYEAMNKLQ